MSPESTLADNSARPGVDVAATVRGILAEYLDRPAEDVRLDSRLEHDLELDSFAMIELTVTLETALRFSMEDVADPQDLNLVTVDDLVTSISSRLASQQRSGEAGHARSHDR